MHAINRIFEQDKEDAGKSVLTIDFANAFNNFKRDVLFMEIAEHTASFLPLAQTKYSSPPHLFLGDAVLSSHSGVQQGGPLGPMFFALILQRLVRKIKDQCPDLSANVWYLDDGTLIGKTGDVKRAFHIIQQECLLLGLELNSHKCELWWPNGDLGQWSDFPAEMKRNVGNGIKLLGIPVGYEHAPHVFNTRISNIEAVDDLLPKIQTLLADLNLSLEHDTQLLLAPLRESKTPQLLISKAMNVVNSRRWMRGWKQKGLTCSDVHFSRPSYHYRANGSKHSQSRA